MKKKTILWLGLALCLVVVGGILFGVGMSMLQWDFTKLSTIQYETNSHTVTEAYRDIRIETDTAQVVFVPSESQVTTVTCYEAENAKHQVSVKDGTLVIEVIDSYTYIGINIGGPKITVSIPKGNYGALSVSSTTGAVEIPGPYEFERVDISVTTGMVTVSGITCTGDLTVDVTTGKAELTDISSENLRSTGATGSIHLKNVIAAEQFYVERDTGSISFEDCDAASLSFHTDTGDISGSLLTAKVFTAHTDTGWVDVPNTATGGRCEASTDTGSIRIFLS